MLNAAKRQFQWTPGLIRQLRSKRTLAEFGELLGTAENTVWRWEAGKVQPGARHTRLLSELAGREHFQTDWKLAGSMTLLCDLDSADAEIAELFQTSLHTARQFTD